MLWFIILAILGVYYYVFYEKLNSENKAVIITIMIIIVELKAILMSSWILAFLGVSLMGIAYFEGGKR